MTFPRLIMNLEKSMPGLPRMTMRTGAKPAAKPAAPAAPPDPAMNPGAHGAVPPTPGQRVTFKHPATGEPTDGHIHAMGGQGATVVDGQGQTHRVPHGSYMHADGPPGADATAGPKPSAQLVRAAAEKHLELGPTAPLAVYACAALLSIGGVDTVHELKSEDVKVVNGQVLVKPDKLKTDEPAVVQMVQQLQQQTPRGPLFQVNGQPITDQALTAYVRRFGINNASGPPPTAPAPMAKSSQHPRVSKAIAKFIAEGIDQKQAVAKALSMEREGKLTDEGDYIHSDLAKALPPRAQAWVRGEEPQVLAKASPAALILPVSGGDPIATWELNGFLCEFRKGTSGIGMVTIDGPGMPLPLHEIVSSLSGAKKFASEAVPALRRGEAPSRGLFQATR